MNAQLSYLQVRVYGTDGATRLFTQNDPELASRTLVKLNPAKLFAADLVSLPTGDSDTTLAASALARIDLVTDQLSVWDYPFVLGAQVELTESEFRECLDYPQPWESLAGQSDIPVFLQLTMVNGQRYFFWMEVAGGLSAMRMSRIQLMLKDPRLIFGLREGGVGILNLTHLAHFTIYPEPPDATDEAQPNLGQLMAAAAIKPLRLQIR